MLAWVTSAAAPAELQAKYSLGVPSLSVTVRFSDEKKPAVTLHVRLAALAHGQHPL